VEIHILDKGVISYSYRQPADLFSVIPNHLQIGGTPDGARDFAEDP
jgi:hypothetical protein